MELAEAPFVSSHNLAIPNKNGNHAMTSEDVTD
jgi:hypothetical protein